MKRSAIIGLALGGLLLSAGSWYVYRQLTKPRVVLGGVQVEGGSGVTEEPKETPLLSELDASLDLNEVLATQAAPPICVEYWRQVLGVKLTQWFQDVDKVGWARPSQCEGQEGNLVEAWARNVATTCVTEKSKCHQGLANYRALLAEFLTAQRRNYLDMPLPLLLSKLQALGLGLAMEPELPLADLFNLVDALRARKPLWLPGQKLVILALAARESREQDPDLRAQIGSRLDQELDQVTANNRHDPTILEIELRRQLARGEDGVEQIKNFVAKSPRSALAHYYLAAALCRIPDREQCQAELETAVKADPSESRFKETMARFQASGENLPADLFAVNEPFPTLLW